MGVRGRNPSDRPRWWHYLAAAAGGVAAAACLSYGLVVWLEILSGLTFKR